MQPISVALETFAPRRQLGEQLALGLDRARTRLLEPLSAAAPGGTRVWFESQPALRETSGDAAWNEARALVQSGGAAFLAVEAEDARPFASSGYFHFGSELAHELVTTACHSITMHVHPGLFAPVPGLDPVLETVELATELAAAARVSSGYIACHIVQPRPEALWARGLGAEAADRLHGCYWGNFLSAGHIGRLGGREELLETCPADIVDLSSGGHELLFLRLSGDPRDDHLEELLELEHFLRPLLPPVTRVA